MFRLSGSFRFDLARFARSLAPACAGGPLLVGAALVLAERFQLLSWKNKRQSLEARKQFCFFSFFSFLKKRKKSGERCC